MENLKSKIIPDWLKVNIDEVLEKQLFNVNRYYAESNPNISNLMQDELFENPMDFLKKLKERWNWHNSYYEDLLEPSYSSLVKDNYKELSSKEIDNLIEIYKTCCLVDEATLVMSGVIKKYLDANSKKAKISENSLTDEDNMLLTPPVETFFAEYQIDHLYYIYLLKTNDKDLDKYKKYLLTKYHANDELIFESRFEKRFSDKLNMDSKEILEDIKGYKISEDYKVKHFYFTLEHSERKAIRDIIIYDNLVEKNMACSLVGISGFLFRKKILEYLDESSILPNKGYIYEYDNDTIIEALKKLKARNEMIMEKDVKLYRQTGDTCAIACLMMALEYYGKMEKANFHDERRLYNIYRSKYMIGTPFAALAFHLSKNGINTEIYHSEEGMFSNRFHAVDQRDFDNAMNEYKEHLNRAVEKGTKVTNGIKIDYKLIESKLTDGNLVILAGEISGIFHAILLTGYEFDEFIVCDPLYKKKRKMTARELEQFMNTSIGKWFISINDKTNKKDELLTNLPKYQKEAKKYMKEEKGSKSNVKKLPIL